MRRRRAAVNISQLACAAYPGAWYAAWLWSLHDSHTMCTPGCATQFTSAGLDMDKETRDEREQWNSSFLIRVFASTSALQTDDQDHAQALAASEHLDSEPGDGAATPDSDN